jgi:hypothetical protein
VTCDALIQTLKAKEGGGLHSKHSSDHSAPPLQSSSSSSAAAAAAAAAAALSQSLPKESISFGNVAVDGKGLNQSKVKKVMLLLVHLNA